MNTVDGNSRTSPPDARRLQGLGARSPWHAPPRVTWRTEILPGTVYTEHDHARVT
jgi:hypothetical protein